MLQIKMSLAELEEIVEGDLLAAEQDFSDSLSNPVSAQMKPDDRAALAAIIIQCRDLAERLAK